MSSEAQQSKWQNFCQEKLTQIKPILQELGFALDKTQVHIAGERYISSSHKLVLVGSRIKDQGKVIIKVSVDDEGTTEIERERKCRQLLDQIDFAYHVFFSPAEILFTKQNGFTFLISEFIEQEKAFLERDIKEQFFLALRAFEGQEGAHATTYEHRALISKAFARYQASDYIKNVAQYEQDINLLFPDEQLKKLLTQSKEYLAKHKHIIDLYGDFLVHWDLVPHNIRVCEQKIYLLDHSSLRFGNKYESWARFINFMSLHNPSLEKMLLDYVKNNRRAHELLALKLMRIFRLIEIIWHYAHTLSKAEGNLLLLNKKRLTFWSQVLRAVYQDSFVSETIIKQYQEERDNLRSADELERQKGLH